MRTIARALVLIAALGTRAIASDSAPNDPKGVFAGTIGDAPIVAQFGGLPDERYTGLYFYTNYAVGIALTAESNGTDLRVQEYAQRDPDSGRGPVFATWTLHRIGDAFTGIWKNRETGKSYDVRMHRIGDLTPMPRDTNGSRPDLADATYRALLIPADTRGTPQQITRHLAVRLDTDLRLGISNVQLTTFAPEPIRERANQTLDANFASRRTSGYREDVRLAYASARALSISIHAEFYCGGAHPSESDDPITLDLRDGSPVPWDHAVTDADAVAKFYAQAAPLLLAPTGDAKLCATVPADYVYWIVPTGLLVRGHYPHVVAVCEVDVVIPAAKARALLAPRYRALLPDFGNPSALQSGRKYHDAQAL